MLALGKLKPIFTSETSGQYYKIMLAKASIINYDRVSYPPNCSVIYYRETFIVQATAAYLSDEEAK